jgi:hypothetical protein
MRAPHLWGISCITRLPFLICACLLSLFALFVSSAPCIASEMDWSALDQLEKDSGAGVVSKNQIKEPLWDRICPLDSLQLSDSIPSTKKEDKGAFQRNLSTAKPLAIDYGIAPLGNEETPLHLKDTGFSNLGSLFGAEIIRVETAGILENEAGEAYEATLYFRQGKGGFEKGASLDYFLPWRLNKSLMVYGQFHAEAPSVAGSMGDSVIPRLDFAAGVGSRLTLSDRIMVGVNGFYDRSWIDHGHYGSKGFGIESAVDIFGDLSHSFETKLNFYKGGGVDAELALNLPDYSAGVDVKLMAGKYRFYDSEFITGSRGGVELGIKGGAISLGYEISQDNLYDNVHKVAANIKLGFSVEDLFRGTQSLFHTKRPQGQCHRLSY